MMYLPYVITEAFCIVYILSVFFRMQYEIGEKRELLLLKKMIVTYVVALVTDMACICMEKGLLPMWNVLDELLNGICFSAIACGCCFWYEFVDLRLNPQVVRSKTWKWLFRLPILLLCLMELGSIGTGWFFSVSEAGEYADGPLFPVQYVITDAYLIAATIHALIRMVRKTTTHEQRREYLYYAVYIAICLLAEYAEEFVAAVPLFALSIFAALQTLFLSIYLDQEYALARKERELSESRTAMMLSQIQPHFLYNALTAITRLCDIDPEKAKKTTMDFSDYLRGNMDLFTQKDPVPFASELHHSQVYTNIEKVRFGDKLNVEYDIETDNFLIPSLTLQPLVENAVKHGVGKKREGGTVHLSTHETAKGWYVTVTDDGVGFDLAQTQSDGRSHIGIDNVRSRLAAQSGGSLTITSVLGTGTTAEIFLPKGDGPHGDTVRG